MGADKGRETKEDVVRLLRATGSKRDALLKAQFGEWAVLGDDLQNSDQSAQLFKTESGLILPGSAVTGPNPLDHVRLYLTAEELLGNGLTVEEIIGQIHEVSLELAVSWCAQWIAKLQHPAKSQHEVDVEFATVHLRDPFKRQVLAILQDRRRVLVNPQALVATIKIALEHCERRGPPRKDQSVGPLVAAMLGVPPHLSTNVEALSEDDMIVGTNAGPLGTYIVANQMFNNPVDWRTLWAGYQRCLKELPVELAGHPKVVNFEEAYFDATGVPLDDLVTVCAVLWARSIGGDPTVRIDHFAPLNWDRDRLESALSLVSESPEAMREELRADAVSMGIAWSTKTFDRYPVVRWDDYLTVINPAWVVNRSTGLWPLFDVRREFEERGDRSRSRRVSTSVEHIYEHYALESIEGLTGTGRVYRDDALRIAFGRRHKVADAAVDYGASWVVVEVTTRSFQLKTAAGASEEALGQDLDDIVKKARQAEATIDNLRANEQKLTGKTVASEARRFYPAVVVTSRFAGNPITFTMLRERLRETGVLQADDCAPLQVLDLEDLHAMEGACERLGASFLGLLQAKSAIERPLVSMREYIAFKYGQNAPYPERIESSWDRWMNTAIGQLRNAQADAGRG